MSTPGGPDQPDDGQPPYQQPPSDPGIYLRPPSPDQLPPYSGPQYAGPPLTMPPDRPPNRTPMIIVVAVLVVALAVVGVVVFTNDDDRNEARQPPPTRSPASSASGVPTPASPSTVAPSPTSPGRPTSVQQITVAPVVRGWHGVLSYKDGVAYDVPPGWKVETPGTLTGFEDRSGQPVALIHGVSTYKDDVCPAVSGSYRGRIGFKTSGGIDPTAAARTGVRTFAAGVARRDDGSSAPVSTPTLQNVTVDGGKIRAEYARATVTLGDSSDCGSPTVLVVAVAFRTGPRTTALFIGYLDQGVPGALPATTLQKIITTLRPYHR